ncbi:MAG: Hsp20/alpha crystallin family protein [Pseudonocardia sediminis]
MALMRFDPFRDFDRFTEQAFGPTRVPRTMPMEAFRRGDVFSILLDLPGVDVDDVDLTVERNVVTIRAERRSPRQEGDEVIVDERPRGTFVRQLFLGDNMDLGRMSAEHVGGVLSLTIPVSEESKPRRVALSTDGGQPRRIFSGDGEQQADPAPEPARAGV